VIPHPYPDRAAFRSWLIDDGFRLTLQSPRAATHSSSPFVWIQPTTDNENDDSNAALPAADASLLEFVGGHDDTLEWCRTFMSPVRAASAAADGSADSSAVATMTDDGHRPDHPHEYDLVVIGGGSGGMAAAKEAAALGAKVACLDYVKPSPHGSTWGLGGTCVNVGCIPKKLFHIGSLLRESIHDDSAAYGLEVVVPAAARDDTTTGGTASGNDDYKELEAPHARVAWGVLRSNIQNYIRGLNFKYRVRLREKNVTYLNQLATFVDPHTIQAVDKKGKVSTLTASRFLVAVGGRPAPLDCEGGDLAISSDDIFSLDKPPGKTLCVGASYISLECAGFIAGMGYPVTVAVRSILLRGFDRECSDRIDMYMRSRGIEFKRQVTPTKLVKTEDGQIHVTFSDGSEDAFDTVLVAIGRFADTDKLGLDRVGVKTNPKNRKIVGAYEQSSVSNIYAVGDVLDVRGLSCTTVFFLSNGSIGDCAPLCTLTPTPTWGLEFNDF
jgi:thioredoxin reductase (NADPH)